MWKRVLKFAVLFLLTIVALGTAGHYGSAYWFENRFIESTDNAYIRGHIVAVAPRVSGYVTEVAVHDNQSVKAGDLLFRIDSEHYEARLAQRLAALDAAKAASERLVEEKALQQALVDEAVAALTAVRAEAKRAARDRTAA
ncbi:MAG: biotin/lipoyl-binding protein, partial [Sneathiellales bacterium]|nr:biotin/lipoyl-binding protein [Sneathiellales bacterium]